MARGSGPIRVGAVAGAVLAGGDGLRMGPGPAKPLRTLQGRPLVAHVAGLLRPQVMRLAIVANDDLEAYAPWADAVLRDPLPRDPDRRRPGPLAGLLAALDWVRASEPHCPFLVTVPADAPFLPPDLVAMMAGPLHVDEPDVMTVRRRGLAHPAIAIWSVRLADDLRRALAEDGVRKVEAFAARHRVAHFDWPKAGADPFFNVNTVADLARAERRLAGG